MKVVIASEMFFVPAVTLKAFNPYILVLAGGKNYRAVKVTNWGLLDENGVYRNPRFSFTTLPTGPGCFKPGRLTPKWVIAYRFRLDAGYMSDSVVVARKISDKWVKQT